MRVHSLQYTLALAKLRQFIAASHARHAELEFMARAIHENFFLLSNPYNFVSLNELKCLADSMGFKIAQCEKTEQLGPEFRGIVDFDENTIHISKAYCPPRNEVGWRRYRAILAHEIGHVLLGHEACSLADLNTVDEATKYLIEEMLASYLGGALLVNEQSYIKRAHEFRFDVNRLSNDFGVTYHTAAHRLVNVSKADFRFTMVDSNRKVIKSYASTEELLPVPLPGSYACINWGASRALFNDNKTPSRETKYQFSYLKREHVYTRLFEMSKVVDMPLTELDGEYCKSTPCAISLACDADQANSLPMKGYNSTHSEIEIGEMCTIRCSSLNGTSDCDGVLDYKKLDLNRVLRDRGGKVTEIIKKEKEEAMTDPFTKDGRNRHGVRPGISTRIDVTRETIDNAIEIARSNSVNIEETDAWDYDCKKLSDAGVDLDIFKE